MSGDAAPNISQLQELALPAPPFSYLPQTWGWLALLALVVLALAVWAFVRWRRWQRDRYRREALARLADLEQALAVEAQRLPALRELPELLKRVALSMPGSPAVARLGGAQWQRFLQDTSPTPLPADLGQQLALLAYGPGEQVAALGQEQTRALLGTCRQWIEVHHVAA